MKREEVVAGAEYATDLGVHVRVEPEPAAEDGSPVTTPSAGWVVEDGEWVQSEAFAQRKVKRRVDGQVEGTEYKAYQTNVAVRAVEVDTKTKVAIEPRRLISDWAGHLEKVAAVAAEREQSEANAAALKVRADKVGVHLGADPRKREVRMSFDAADTLLRKAKV